MQKILSLVRRAIEDYDMIQDGDKVAVGLSGGKDSITLLTALKMYQRFAPFKYELVAIAIDLFDGDTNYQKIIDYCNELGVELHIVKSKIYKIVFERRNENNPCSLCAKLRRGILNNEASALGCNKIALGHHADDLVETFMLSMFYEARLSTFQPTTYLNMAKATVIRPLIHIREKQIIGASKDLPIITNMCPMDKHSKREYVKDLLKDIGKSVPNLVNHIHSALIHGERNHLIPPIAKNITTNDSKQED